jgi:hypothetical protein
MKAHSAYRPTGPDTGIQRSDDVRGDVTDQLPG